MSIKIFLGNLNFELSERELTDYLTPYGLDGEVTIVRDPHSGRSRGFAYAAVHDEKAILDLDGAPLNGRRLHVKRARTQRGGLR
jgi:RNA recognition motif-containing protein